MKPPITEIRVWEENGKVHTREIINESIGDVDMTPHPTECKIIVLEDDVKLIYSQEIEDTDEIESNLNCKITTIWFNKFMDMIDNGRSK